MELCNPPPSGLKPPVIHGTDAHRVAAARCGILAAAQARGFEHAVADEAVAALLTDLHHFCAARRIDFEYALDLAAHHFQMHIRDAEVARFMPEPEVCS